MRGSVFSRCLPALIEAAERHLEVAEFHHQYNARRRGALVQAIADGVAAGDFPAHTDPEQTALALAGAIVYSRLMTAATFDPARVEDLVTAVLSAPRPKRRIT